MNLLCNNSIPVKSISPIAPYVGGKKILAKTIIARINSIPHNRYVEPFFGMGGIFLRREKRTPNEVINDYNNEVYNLFKVIKNRKNELIDLIEYTLSSRKFYTVLKCQDPNSLTDDERAFRYLYLLKHSFGGKLFGGLKSYRGSFNTIRLKSQINRLHERLSHVFIDNLDYKKFIELHDKQQTLMYLDPPYLNTEHYYPQNNNFNFEEFAQVVKNIKCSWILSINNCEQAVAAFADNYYISVLDYQQRKHPSQKKAMHLTELLISNSDHFVTSNNKIPF